MVVVAILLICLGTFFLFMGAVGLVRFPDFYTRMHAAGKCDSLGSLLLFAGLACYQGLELVSVRIMFIALLIFVTSPTATHAIARAAFKSNLAMWTKDQR